MVSRDPVERFIESAESFCSLIDAVDTVGLGEFVWEAGRRLADLYVAACELPEVEATTSDAISGSRPDEDWARQERVRAKLGELDVYARIYDPYAKDSAFEGSLSQDLTGVYDDLADGLRALNEGAQTEDVVWEWRFAFGHHWGIHAGAALYAIHWLTHTAGEQWVAPHDR